MEHLTRLGLVIVRPTRSDAIRRKGGNVFPRFAARRSMPAQAFALKKYRRGTAPVSKMSDNEDAASALGHSEELSVQDSPGATIPEFCQRPQDGSKIPPPFEDRTPGTFSQTTQRGRSLPASRQNSMARLPRGSSRPPRCPATEKDWQGVPPARTSTAPRAAGIFLKSPRLGTSG